MAETRKRRLQIEKKDEKKKEEEFIAPDGGWGWVIVAGFGFNNFFIIPIIYSFGLIFIDRFNELNFNKQDVTLLMSLNSWFGMILGIFNGPLLKKFGYRKMAFIGITLFLIGFFFTGLSTKYFHFVIFYGLINSVGYVLLMASFNLAFNSFFKFKRSHAAGRVAFLTAIGPIVMPLLISFLLQNYGTKWTVFILSAATLNAYAGACLLQPIKWHVKKPKEEEVKIVVEENALNPLKTPEVNYLPGYETPTIGSTLSIPHPEHQYCSQDISPKSEYLTFFDIRKCASDNLTKRKESVIPLDNERHIKVMQSLEDLTESNNKNKSLVSLNEIQKIAGSNEEVEKPSEGDWGVRSWEYIKDLYDLDLLADPIYLNIMAGISIASIGELMFSLLTPFILNECGLDLDQKAYFMSIVAFCDTIARFIAPYIGDKIKLQSRAMYGTALLFLFITRAFMFLPTSYEGFYVVAVGLGLGKGIRTVYWAIVLPDYVPIRKLPSAAAIQSLANGVLLAVSGPIIGAIISISGSYTNAIIACNVLTITTVIMWYTEFTVIWYRNRKKGKIIAGEEELEDVNLRNN